MRDPDAIDQGLWRKRDVTILDVPLEEYIVKLREALLASARK
jgi:hypothetical protein